MTELRSVMSEARRGLEVAVQHERVEVGAVRPYDGAQLVVHTHLGEEVRVGEGLEHGSTQLAFQVNVARATVAEAESEPVVTEHLYRCDAHEVHVPILRQRVDRLGSAAVLRALPISFQFLAVQTCPLVHEPECTTRQRADDHRPVANRDRGMMLGVLGVEMGRVVVIEVHRDHDAVEEADPGHVTIMRDGADGDGGSDSTTNARLEGKPEATRATTAHQQRPDGSGVTNRAHGRILCNGAGFGSDAAPPLPLSGL